MKLIVGLGNPGEKFKDTRHNVGFVVLDRLVQIVGGEWSMDNKFNSLTLKYGDSVVFLKPQTFMNSSGPAVQKLVKLYKIKRPNLWIIHDDLDIKLGSYKIQTKGPKVHNGLLSIYENIGIKDFWHVRIGIENRTPEQRKEISGEGYVLQKFTSGESSILDTTLEKVTQELMTKLKDQSL